MAVVQSSSPNERNKMIAAAVLGLVALVALYFAFGRGMFGGSTAKATTSASATPTPGTTPVGNRSTSTLPTASEQDFVFQTTAVNYRPGDIYAPDAGRNIFAFYEPPPPCKGADCPTPVPPPVRTPPPPSPLPTPPLELRAANPGNVFAGSKGFNLEVLGQYFTGDSRVYFDQVEMPTTFISPEKLTANIPSNLIAQEGSRQIIVQTPDGKLYSNQLMLSIMAPPKPGYQYIGMIARKRYNNDTAYLMEPGKDKPFGARLNDIIGGRFRLVDISAAEVVFEDKDLGFRHKIAVEKNTGGGMPGAGGGPIRPGAFNPAGGSRIPGIPDNIPRYTAPAPPPSVQPANPIEKKESEKKEDVDDNGDDR